MSIRALLLDFDGVLVASEPLHHRGFQIVLEPLGIELTWEEYRERYMGYGDRDAFTAILRDRGRFGGERPPQEELEKLCREKARVVAELWHELKPLPGVLPFLEEASSLYLMGVVSGALHKEVVSGLERIGALPYISTVVAAEDVEKGKPDPEGYLKACARLSAILSAQGDPPLSPYEAVAFEDTAYGLKAARAAHLYTVGLLGSEPPQALAPYADLLLSSLTELKPQDLECLCETRPKETPQPALLELPPSS